MSRKNVPQESARWSNEVVADRWLSAFPPRAAVTSPEDADEIIIMHRALLLAMPEKFLHARKTPGSLSMFMKPLKQLIAYLANKEDNCTGHFSKVDSTLARYSMRMRY